MRFSNSQILATVSVTSPSLQLSLPAFLAFYDGKLIESLAMGGKAKNLTKSEDPPRVLLIEPIFKDQILSERSLKGSSWIWDLALQGDAAMNHIRRLQELERRYADDRRLEYSYGVVMVSSAIDPTDARAVSQLASGISESPDCVIACSVVPYSEAVAHGCEVVDGVVQTPPQALLHDGVCTIAITKPVKKVTLKRVASIWHKQLETVIRRASAANPGDGIPPKERQGRHVGHTEQDLLDTFEVLLDKGRRGEFAPPSYRHGLSLTAETARFKGVRLVGTLKRTKSSKK